jgi:hypothetical protein
MKHTLGWTTMRSKDKAKNQTDLDLITLAYNIKLTHNHKTNKTPQKQKLTQNSMSKPICT